MENPVHLSLDNNLDCFHFHFHQSEDVFFTDSLIHWLTHLRIVHFSQQYFQQLSHLFECHLSKNLSTRVGLWINRQKKTFRFKWKSFSSTAICKLRPFSPPLDLCMQLCTLVCKLQVEKLYWILVLVLVTVVKKCFFLFTVQEKIIPDRWFKKGSNH